MSLSKVLTTSSSSTAFRSFRPFGVASRGSRGNAHIASSGLKSVQPSLSEIKARRLTPQNIQLTLEALHEDGMVMIDRAIPNFDQIKKVRQFISFTRKVLT